MASEQIALCHAGARDFVALSAIEGDELDWCQKDELWHAVLDHDEILAGSLDDLADAIDVDEMSEH